MEKTIMELVRNCGFNSVLIAAAVFAGTGLAKMPLKYLAGKTSKPEKYTKFITFLPVVLAFGMTALYEAIVSKGVTFSGEFIRLWLTSSSLSLAFYAFWEKFFPGRKKILQQEEIRQNVCLIDKLKTYFDEDKGESEGKNAAVSAGEKADAEKESEARSVEAENAEREASAGAPALVERGAAIVLRGKKHD